MFQNKLSPFLDAVSAVKKLPLEEIRVDSADFFEAVVQAEFARELDLALNKSFGPPAKHAGKQASNELNKLVVAYGGIRKEQTLYHASDQESFNYVMVWPWANKILLTVKIVRKTKQV